MLELAKTNGFFVLTVSDRGKGLNPQILDTASPPSGLGLLSLRERARYIGGSFVIESAPNLGSRFTLTVPASISGKDEGPRPTIEYRTDQLAEASHSVGAVGTRVLFVDDHQIMRQGLINLTGTQPGIHVAGEASNGHEAIEKARNLKPNVIVMDISMPEMDGIEATRRIKAEWPNVRVIGLTMHDDFQQTDAMQQAGAEMVLSKTTSADELARAIYGKQ
jgi:CheY-like chemotaxis protein